MHPWSTRRSVLLPAVAVAALTGGCAQAGATTATPTGGAIPQAGGSPMSSNDPGQKQSVTVHSSAFAPGRPIPRQYTADGRDISPPLSWSGVSAQAKQLALIVDDPDAPSRQPWVHWVLYGLSPDTRSLPAGVPHGKYLSEPIQAKQGPNSFANHNLGYRGPAPPPGHGAHHYHFTLYVLDQALDLRPGLTKAQLLAAIKGRVIEQGQLIGTYQRY